MESKDQERLLSRRDQWMSKRTKSPQLIDAPKDFLAAPSNCSHFAHLTKLPKETRGGCMVMAPSPCHAYAPPESQARRGGVSPTFKNLCCACLTRFSAQLRFVPAN
eukprot:146251-Amphidinium_carterae.1